MDCVKWWRERILRLRRLRYFRNGLIQEKLDDEHTLVYVEYSLFYICVFSFWYFSYIFVIIFVMSLMLPEDIIFFVGDDQKARWLGIYYGVSCGLQFLLGPLSGNLSDKTPLWKWKKFELGKRKPYIYVGMFIYLGSLFVRSIFRFKGFGWFLFYFIIGVIGNGGQAVALTTYTAMFPDLFHWSQYNLVSGAIGFAQSLGGVLGVGILGFFYSDSTEVWLVLVNIVIGVIGTLSLVVFREGIGERNKKIQASFKKKQERQQVEVSSIEEKDYLLMEEEKEEKDHLIMEEDEKEKRKPLCIRIFKDYIWGYILQFLSPFRHWNFFVVFFARFIFMFCTNGIQNFLLYYIRDVIAEHGYSLFYILPSGIITNEEQAQSVLSVIMCVCMSIASFGGPLLARSMERKWVVFLSGVVMITSNLGWITFQNFSCITIYSILYGFGSGSFYAVDMALMNEVLPVPEDSAKDLGIMGVATMIPASVVSPIAGNMVSFGQRMSREKKVSFQNFGYYLMFGTAIVVQCVGTAMITLVKSKKIETEITIMDEEDETVGERPSDAMLLCEVEEMENQVQSGSINTLREEMMVE